MYCEKCGAKLEENALFCSECGEQVLPATEPEEEPAQMAAFVSPEETAAAPAPVQSAPEENEKKVSTYKPRRKPHIALRVLLQLLSLVLCLVLSVSLIVTVVLADLNHIMSTGGMKQLVSAILTPVSAPHRAMPIPGAAGVYWEEADFTVPEDLDIEDIPEDILAGGNTEENMNSLVDWIYEQMAATMEGTMPISKEVFADFMADSTITDYLADKLAGFAEDFINGTENTQITGEEVQDLLEENMDLIEEKFQVTLSEEEKQQLIQSLEQMLEKKDINTVIRDQVFATVEDSINENAAVTGMNWEQLQPKLQALFSDATLYTALGICGGLMLLLCLANFYNVPAGLTWIALPCIIVGAILTLPLLALPSLMPMMGGAAAMAMQVATSFVTVLLPFHAAVPIFGFVLLIVSIVWRIIRANVDRKRRLAAA